jgi:hypothetical protein
MTTSVSRRLNIICIKFKILYNKSAHLVMRELAFYLHVKKNLHDHIISLRREIWSHKNSLNPPPTFYWNACTNLLSRDSELPYISMWGVLILPPFHWFVDWIWELWRQCGVFLFFFHFITTIRNHSMLKVGVLTYLKYLVSLSYTCSNTDHLIIRYDIFSYYGFTVLFCLFFYCLVKLEYYIFHCAPIC